jgi:plasmid stability protein
MASLTIRNLDATLKQCLRLRAAQHGRSMEEEARCILRQALGREPEVTNLADLAQALFGANGVELAPHPPVQPREPPPFGS